MGTRVMGASNSANVTAAKRAVIYTRISRDDTGDGVANQRQEEDCRKLAELRGWTVVAVEADVSISAYSEKKRPAWERVKAMIVNGEVDVVIVWHIDRLTRRMSELESLISLSLETGAGIATVSGDIDLTTDVGRMVARILGAVATAEVERKAARQRRANQQRAAQGIPWNTGFRAFGYVLDGKVVEEEAELLREAAEDVLNGTPLRAIVRRWRELGVPTARSRKGVNGWTHNSVRAILLNPRNAGIATYKGEVIGKGSWEPIISEETHTLLVAMLKDPSRLKGDRNNGNKPNTLLSSIAACGKCGEKVQAGSSQGMKVYKCTGPGEHITTSREQADAIVQSAFAASVAVTMPGTVMSTRDRSVPADLWDRRKQLNTRLETLALSFANGVLTDGQLEVATASLREQLAELDAQIEASATEPEDWRGVRAEDVRNFLNLDVFGQRKVLEELTTIKLWPRNHKKNVPIEHQVTMYIHDRRGRTWAALDERNGTVPDPSAAKNEALADALVEQQPEGVTTLRGAAQWLVDAGLTDLAPSGLPGRLSPLVRYGKTEVNGGEAWVHKSG